MNQGYENAHAALKMWGEADAAGDTRLKNLAYDNFIRAKRLIDAEEFDKEIYDDFGNLCKPAGEMSGIPSYEDAWKYELPEDKPIF